jgi:hypothetical protein
MVFDVMEEHCYIANDASGIIDPPNRQAESASRDSQAVLPRSLSKSSRRDLRKRQRARDAHGQRFADSLLRSEEMRVLKGRTGSGAFERGGLLSKLQRWPQWYRFEGVPVEMSGWVTTDRPEKFGEMDELVTAMKHGMSGRAQRLALEILNG